MEGCIAGRKRLGDDLETSLHRPSREKEPSLHPSRRNRNELRDSKQKGPMRTHTHMHIYTVHSTSIHNYTHIHKKNNQYNLTTLCVVKFKFLMNVVCLDTVAFSKKKETKNTTRFLNENFFLFSK